MNKDIINLDKQGNLHGKQIYYHSNDNITWIENYYHGKYHGYQAWFKINGLTNDKASFNMNECIYSEAHWTKQIQINI